MLRVWFYDIDMKSNIVNESLLSTLREFLESEARSCSMDPGCITPEYVFRMWGGKVPLEQIDEALTSLK